MKTTKILRRLLSLAVMLCLLSGCGGNISLANLSSKEIFNLGMEKYNKKKYLRSIELFQTVIYNYSGESIVDTAQFYLGMSYFNNTDYELAAVEFNRLAVNYPSSDFFEESIFSRAVSYYKSTPKHYALDQADLDQSIKYFEDFIIDFPESPRVIDANGFLREAHTRLARKYYEAAVVYSRIGGSKAAQIYCQKVIDNYTNTDYAALATFLNAEMFFKLKKYEEARINFENFIAVFSDHEKVLEAKEKIIEAAFKGAELAFKKGDYDVAREKSINFKIDFPESNKVKKVDKFLNKIAENTAEKTITKNDES